MLQTMPCLSDLCVLKLLNENTEVSNTNIEDGMEFFPHKFDIQYVTKLYYNTILFIRIREITKAQDLL